MRRDIQCVIQDDQGKILDGFSSTNPVHNVCIRLITRAIDSINYERRCGNEQEKEVPAAMSSFQSDACKDLSIFRDIKRRFDKKHTDAACGLSCEISLGPAYKIKSKVVTSLVHTAGYRVYSALPEPKMESYKQLRQDLLPTEGPGGDIITGPALQKIDTFLSGKDRKELQFIENIILLVDSVTNSLTRRRVNYQKVLELIQYFRTGYPLVYENIQANELYRGRLSAVNKVIDLSKRK